MYVSNSNQDLTKGKNWENVIRFSLVISSIITALLSMIDSRNAQRQFHPKITRGNVLNAVIFVVKVLDVYLLNAFICFHLWMKGLKMATLSNTESLIKGLFVSNVFLGLLRKWSSDASYYWHFIILTCQNTQQNPPQTDSQLRPVFIVLPYL